MNTSQLRQQINYNLERLSPDNLQIVAEFLNYLADKERELATQELLDIPGFIAYFERGKLELKTGEILGLMYNVVLSAEAEKIYISATESLAKKLARCFEQLEQLVGVW
ncbi:MAG: hypothetical protein ACKO11_08670 [Cuspidothrix sp.]